MAVKVLDLAQMKDWIRTVGEKYQKAHGLALIDITQIAEKEVKINARNTFGHAPSTVGRIRSGGLMKAIFSGYEIKGKANPTGFVGTRGIPYGAVHEFGHDNIRPVKAKNLWVKNYNRVPSKFRHLTPREFFDEKKADPNQFALFRSQRGNLIAWYMERKARKNKMIPLFFLKKKVAIKPRPYLRPAIEVAIKEYPKRYEKYFKELLSR